MISQFKDDSRMPENSPNSYEEAINVLNIIENNGYNARLAGGCVRDRYLGLEPKDYDIATNAHPTEITRIFGMIDNWKPVPTGVEHGTVTLVSPEGISFEVTTLRKDAITDGRRAKVVFGDSFEEDAARRDFTINALYEDKNGTVYDYYQGLNDLNEGRLRFVGDPARRITEDYLRILRFFRFWIRFDLKPHSENLKAIKKHCKGLEIISQERITAEVWMLLEFDDPTPAIAAMIECGALKFIFAKHQRTEIPLKKIAELRLIPKNSRVVCRLLLFLAENLSLEEIAQFAKNFKLSNSARKKLQMLSWGPAHLPPLTADNARIMGFIDKIEGTWSKGSFLAVYIPAWKIIHPQKCAILEKLRTVELQWGELRQQKMPISGHILSSKFNIEEGVYLGIILKKLKRSFRNGYWSNRDEGLKFAEELIAKGLERD